MGDAARAACQCGSVCGLLITFEKMVEYVSKTQEKSAKLCTLMHCFTKSQCTLPSLPPVLFCPGFVCPLPGFVCVSFFLAMVIRGNVASRYGHFEVWSFEECRSRYSRCADEGPQNIFIRKMSVIRIFSRRGP
jgi:hypothetical protein